MNYTQCAKEICEKVGGIKNVTYCTNCATRLRLTIADDSKVDLDGIKKIDGVVGAVFKGGQYQIIIGSDVSSVRSEFEKLGNISKEKQEKKGKLIDRILDVFAGIFTPLIPVLTGAGMLKVVLTLLTFFNLLDKSGNTYYVLNFMSDATFYFLPILVGISTANKIGVNPYMAAVIGCMLLHPNFIALKDAGEAVNVFGLPLTLISYASSVIPSILATLLLKYVEPFADKITPKQVKFLLRPLITMMVVGIATLLVLGPIGSWIGDGIAFVCNLLNTSVPWLVPTLMGAFMPLLVMTGMHWSFAPVILQSYATFGYEAIMGPGSFVSNLCQGAASLAVALKTKKSDLKQTAGSAGVTALFGVTEPALFGVTIQHKKVLYSVLTGGAIGGLVAGLLGVVRYTSGTPGLLSFAIFIGENPMNVVNAFISAGVGFVITFALTFFWGYKDEDTVDNTKETTVTSEIGAVVDGTLVDIKNVNDETFAEEIIGKGIAITPEDNVVYAPVSGKILTFFPTKHAIGLIDENGVEVLIHVGIDTVKLEGKYFEKKVDEGSFVVKGEKLLQFDREAIEKAGYDCTVITVVTNPDEFETITKVESGKVMHGDTVMNVQ